MKNKADINGDNNVVIQGVKDSEINININNPEEIKIGQPEKDKMIEILREYKNGKISLYSIQDKEAIKFAALIKEIFNAADWNVFDGGIFSISMPIEGIHIWVNNPKMCPIRINEIVNAINVLKIIPEVRPFFETSPDDLMLIIGSKKS